MNVFILTDLEGLAGVTDIEFMDRTGEKYALGRKLLSHSIDLAVKTCFDAGAKTVYYLDGHGGGGNVLEELIDARAVKCDIPTWQELLRTGKVDCQIELGSHARAGTVGGFLDHTLSSKLFFAYKINDVEMSELSMHALVATAHGVPIIACIGDEAACRQAKEYIPEIVTGAVKHADCRNLAQDYENADEILVGAEKKALANRDQISLYRTAEPAVVELTYYRTDMCEHTYAHCGENVTRVDARTLRKTVEKINDYYDLKF